MITGKYNDLMHIFSKLCNLDEIHSHCCVVCEELGFDNFIYGVRFQTSFVKPHMVIVSSYPSEWRERYDAQGYLNIDPTVSYCSSNLLPLTWEHFEPKEKQDKAVHRFWEESREFGLKSGISIPIHDAQRGRAMLSLTSRKDRVLESHHTAMSPFVQAIAFHLHEAVRRTLNTAEIFPDRHQLSNRETQCLLWTAEGKTSWETSKILGISERTVIFHMQKVSDKLQVANRLQAVARAVSMGIIS